MALVLIADSKIVERSVVEKDIELGFELDIESLSLELLGIG